MFVFTSLSSRPIFLNRSFSYLIQSYLTILKVKLITELMSYALVIDSTNCITLYILSKSLIYWVIIIQHCLKVIRYDYIYITTFSTTSHCVLNNFGLASCLSPTLIFFPNLNIKTMSYILTIVLNLNCYRSNLQLLQS